MGREGEIEVRSLIVIVVIKSSIRILILNEVACLSLPANSLWKFMYRFLLPLTSAIQ